MIAEKTIQEVRELPIETIIGSYVKLKRNGSSLQGLCPFHNEKTPSFSVSPSKNAYHCFGCGAGGDGIRFVMEHERLTFLEAVEHLAHQHGIAIEYEEGKSPDPAEKEKRITDLKKLRDEAERYYKQLSPAAIAYIRSRHLKPETVREWRLGYADSAFFAGRLTIPIENTNGDVVGFGGRIIPCEGIPTVRNDAKYLNSPASDYYNKSKILFGLSHAKAHIRKSGYAILVEGYTDTIRLHQYGWKQAVATCGTALTEEHSKLLRKYTDTVYIMRDGDNAGMKAVIKDIEILSHDFSNIKLILLPKGEDPDSLFAFIERGGWHDFDITDGFMWQCAQWLTEAHYDTVATVQAISKCSELLARLNDQVQRDMYVQQLCKQFKLKEKQFKTALSDKLQQETGSLFPDDEIPKWVNLSKFWNDGFVMNNDTQKDRVGIYFKGDSKAIIRLTNYVIKPLYFIMDANNPRRLIEIFNGYKTYVIELTNRAFVSQDAFEVEVSGRPGFYSEPGFGKIHYKKLVNWINENTKTVFELKTLGWQPEGFFAYANKVVIPGKGAVDYDEYGIATVNEHHYLSPGVSKMNVDMREGDNIYENDLYLKYGESPITFEQWAKLFYEVYDEHAAFGIAFIFISAFKDIVTRAAKQPMPYFYGPKGSGKSALGESMMWFFFSGKNSDGKLIQAFNLNPGQGTPFAFFNRMQRFRNVFMLYNEFDPNNIEPWKRGAFKAAYDGEGRETGSGESYKKRKTEIQKMQCVPGIAGQYLDTADDAALMSRSVPFRFSLETNKARTTEQKAKWEQLNDYEMKGISSLAAGLYQHREKVAAEFKDLFWKEQTKLTNDLRRRNYVPEPRVLNNYSVCLAMVRIMSSVVTLPFDYDLFYADCIIRAIEQTKALKDNNILSGFWSTMEVIFDDGFFEDGIHFKIAKESQVRIKEGTDITVKKFDAPVRVLYLRLSIIHDKIAKRMREKTGKAAPDEANIITYLKDQAYYLGLCPGEYFRDKTTSAYMVNYDLLELTGVVLEKNVQLGNPEMKVSYKPQEEPATVKQEDLPF